MKTFKEYENIDKSCEECIFEHELEGIQEAEDMRRRQRNRKGRRSTILTSPDYEDVDPSLNKPTLLG